ncbi:MAG: LysE family translocator [Flavobacteriaceae bacterium]|nr:LysE family translocator [Flavobacteriaceae bacterium]MCB0474406.1 LysE family translocator [Flavobacteriaceae bacterium]
MNTDIVISFLIASTALAFAPGPDNIYVLVQSVSNGIKYGLATVFGLVTGCLVHTSLVAFGVSALIGKNEELFFMLKLFGAIYMVYLAYRVYKSKAGISFDNAGIPSKGLLQLYRQGFIMNVLNPKVSLFFLALFPGFLFSNTIPVVNQFFVLGFLFMLVTLVVFSLIAVMAGFISDFLKGNTRAPLVIKWLQIIVFIGIAIFILLADK